MKFTKSLIILCLCLLILIPVVNAETLTNDLSGGVYNQTTFGIDYSSGGDLGFSQIKFTDIQYSNGITTIIRNDAGRRPEYAWQLFPIAGNSNAVTFTDSQAKVVGTGTIGYQRRWDNAWPIANEIDGYQYVIFSSLNITGMTGSKIIYIYNFAFPEAPTYRFSGMTTAPSGQASIATDAAGNYTIIRNTPFHNSYSATKPAGLGITGYVYKHALGDSTQYYSRAYVFDGLTNEALLSQNSPSATDLYFNVPSQTIKIGVQDGSQNWYNSSVLFSYSPTPTYTPTPTPTIPSTSIISTNLTITAKSISGNQPIIGASVEVFFHNQVFSSYSGITNSIGQLVINNVQHYNNEEFDLEITKSGYQTWFNSFNIPNTPNYPISANLIPLSSPSPTPAPYDVWSLEAIPSSINLGDTAQLHLSCSNASKFASDAGIVIYYENKNLGGYSPFNIIGIFLYNSSASNWDYKPTINSAYDYSPHDPVLFDVNPTTTGTYTYNVGISKLDSTALGTASTDLIIDNGGMVSTNLIMTLGANDGATTSHLQNYTLTLTESIGGISHVYDVEYDIDVNLQRGKIFSLKGEKIGYVDNTITFTVPVNQNVNNGDFGTFISVPLFPIGTISAGNTTVTVHVDDKETYYPIPNVQITMSGILSPKFTGTDGESASFILPQNTPFTVKASKDGYCAVTQNGNTSTNDYLYVPMYMKFGGCAGVTPTHTPIPTIPTPTITIIGVTNTTYDTGVCYSNWTLAPKNQSIILQTKNYLACAGFLDSTLQNLVISLILILLIALIGAWKAAGIGFGIGAVIGAVISMAAGLFPVWLIVVMVILVIGVIALKVFGSGG
jgi:hypothetical protein